MRRLTLSRETLADLTPEDLGSVRAAGAIPTVDVLMCLTIDRTCILTTR
ncbi:MAG TPA: hypothetical protein VGX28_06545 [Frankiaceae bacterium]|jgi:hypothetical protein|nr:hypothetical protein [Frankiaceae bacterium]